MLGILSDVQEFCDRVIFFFNFRDYCQPKLYNCSLTNLGQSWGNFSINYSHRHTNQVLVSKILICVDLFCLNRYCIQGMNNFKADLVRLCHTILNMNFNRSKTIICWSHKVCLWVSVHELFGPSVFHWGCLPNVLMAKLMVDGQNMSVYMSKSQCLFFSPLLNHTWLSEKT